MHTEGNEIHAEGDEARAGSTPNIVRWVLAISLLAAILLLSAIWMFGAATTDEEDRVATASDRMEKTEAPAQPAATEGDEPPEATPTPE